MTDPLLLIPGVTPFEQLGLEEALPAGVEFRPEELPPDQHGEFLTATAVVAVSTLAIRAIAAWLAMNRSQDNTIEEEVEVELPSGVRVSRRLTVHSRTASELPAQTASALTELLQAGRAW